MTTPPNNPTAPTFTVIQGGNQSVGTIATNPAKPQKPYAFSPAFEQHMVALLCSSRVFGDQFLAFLDPKLFGAPLAIEIVTAAKAVYGLLGHGIEDTSLVLEWFCEKRRDGKMTQAKIDEVCTYLDKIMAEELPEPDSIGKLLTIQLKDRYSKSISEAVIDVRAKGGQSDFTQIREMISVMEGIGTNADSIGTTLGEGVFTDLARLRSIERAPTYIPDLDGPLGGGIGRGKSCLIIGPPGGGKSIFMSSMAGQAVLNGEFVCVASLEPSLPEEEYVARCIASMLGEPIDDVIAGLPHIIENMKALIAQPNFGILCVRSFTPKVTTLPDIHRWFKSCEQKYKKKITRAVYDYQDQITGTAKTTLENEVQVANGIATYGAREQIFTFAAAQPGKHEFKVRKRNVMGAKHGQERGLIDLDGVGGSSEKTKVPDTVITINPEEDESGKRWITFLVGKHRGGVARFKVGPVETQFEIGRICSLEPLGDPEDGAF